MDNSLDMDGSVNRSLTNSQIYDGEFFEIVDSEGEILVVRYEQDFMFSLWLLITEFCFYLLLFTLLAVTYAHRMGMMVNCYALRSNQMGIF